MDFIITDILVVIACSHPVGILKKDSTTSNVCKIKKKNIKNVTRHRDSMQISKKQGNK